jgi:hypothetical protein
VRGALHAIALRTPRGTAVALPRAERIAGLVALELRRFAGRALD